MYSPFSSTILLLTISIVVKFSRSLSISVLIHTSSDRVYKVSFDMTHSPKLYFDCTFILYYIVYDYRLIIIYWIAHFITNLIIVPSLYYNS